jgi:dipeptidyl aminopeptidase/acylaminoacyl peptidase
MLFVTTLAGLEACVDDVSPFRAEGRPDRAPPVRLTTGPGEDRLPAWSTDGRSIYYIAERFDGLDQVEGLLLRLPADGGSASPALLNVQSPGARSEPWLVAPAPAPGGQRIAFSEIIQAWPPHPCRLGPFHLSCTPTLSEEDARLPPLRRLAQRVRELDATGPLEEDRSLEFDVLGVTPSLIVNNYPFQAAFARERAFGLRASWDPAGERLAFSDGLRLYVWSVGSEDAEPIPNSEDAIWPAWSPDGERIAFTRLPRADSSSAVCRYFDNVGALNCIQQRTDYIAGPARLSLIRPDGSGLTEIGEGYEPAWAPDGGSLFFRRGSGIWRSGVEGAGAAPVPGGAGAREPAVSPDGQRLAVAKLSEGGDHDIWVLPLEP